MKEEYYKPEIEDLFIGYECEIQTNYGHESFLGYEDWTSIVIDYRKDGLYTTQLSDIIIGADDNYRPIRTKFLTKEQIENEGWKERKDNELIYIKTGRFILNFSFNENRPTVGISYNDNYHKGYYFFLGQCKSINEFRKICKYLNI